MSTWRDIGSANAKIANEEMRLKAEASRSSSQTAILSKISADLSDIKVLLKELLDQSKSI